MGLFTEDEVNKLAEVWYQKLDVHAPVGELLPLLANDGLEMRFPEGTVRGHDGFQEWYEGVIRKFFDEVHTLKEVTIQGDGSGETANVKVLVNWQAKIWNPPAPKSEWLGFDAYQTWVVRRADDGSVVILTYIVDDLKPMPGSVAL